MGGSDRRTDPGNAAQNLLKDVKVRKRRFALGILFNGTTDYIYNINSYF